ncbi:hypothetical protein VDG1235_3820 [Verrucomicrobiia bacterium DG1235]|nr:hypothetical protein VDG1235_3820 [Verrucomicrobiae bacterium DG1235]
MEHSGTTFLTSLIKSNTNTLNCAFECGVLLSKTSPKDFNEVQPFYDWLCMPVETGQWGLTKQERNWVCATENWREFYVRLAQASPAIRPGQQLIDKTPAYAYNLCDIISRVPETPFIIILKDIRLLYKSYKKRKVPIELFLARYLKYKESLDRALDSDRDNIYLIDHKKLCCTPEQELGKIFRSLQIDIPVKINSQLENTELPPLTKDYNYEKEVLTLHEHLTTTELDRLSRITPNC